MKRLLLIIPILLLLNACTHGVKVENGHQAPPPPVVEEVEKSNTIFLQERAIAEVKKQQDPTKLKTTISFMEHRRRVEATGRKLLVTTVEPGAFPFFLKDVFAHHKLLNSLPRDVNNLEIVDSYKVTGTQNIFYRVPAKLVPSPFDVLSWMAREEEWAKFVDPVANGLEEEGVYKSSPAEVFISLFYDANNNDGNQELIIAFHLYKEDWSKIPHPEFTKAKYILIPVATVTSQAMIDIIRLAQQK